MRFSSPTRIDFAGGTLDCWPLYNLTGGARVTNLSVGIWTHVDVDEIPGNGFEIHIQDLKYQKAFPNLSDLLNCHDSQIDLLKEVLRYFEPTGGIRVSTKSESPIGGGLGGSSSLCVSLIKAFLYRSGRVLEPEQVVTIAHNLEARLLKKPTGTQDYFPALVSGLNVIHYTAEGPRLETLAVNADFLSKHLTLIYTGQPHHSGLNNWQVIKAAMEGDAKTIEALHLIREIGDEMADVCRSENWSLLADLFRREFAARVMLSPGFSSERIENLKKMALENGADAIKICGAGGGGCVFLWSPPQNKQGVEKICHEKGFQVLDVKPVFETPKNQIVLKPTLQV